MYVYCTTARPACCGTMALFQLTNTEIKYTIGCKIRTYSVCLPSVRPGWARCRAPEILHNKGNGNRFSLRKCCSQDELATHCTMATGFLINFLACTKLAQFKL